MLKNMLNKHHLLVIINNLPDFKFLIIIDLPD